MQPQSASQIVNLVFKAIAVAVSVAAVVLQTIGAGSVQTTLTLLSIGLFTLAVSSIQKV
ncbi:MAG: hypothetical protein WCF84_08435 [Anaerolineae bacterium]